MTTLFEQLVLEKTNTQTISLAVEKLAAEYSAGNEGQNGVPDLQYLAERLGVKSVKIGDIPCDGALIPTSDKTYEVWLKSDVSWRRRRFSLAHELAHAILHNLLPQTRQISTRNLFTVPGNQSEERICDAIAAALIMPKQCFLKELFKHDRISVGVVEALSKKFGTSLQATAIRCQEVSIIEFALFNVTGFDGDCIKVDRVVVNSRGQAMVSADDGKFQRNSRFGNRVANSRSDRGCEWYSDRRGQWLLEYDYKPSKTVKSAGLVLVGKPNTLSLYNDSTTCSEV